jgi:methylmalonyl-CoA mutase N-terminal domain/subunit
MRTVEMQQIERLAAFKQKRDQVQVQQKLSVIKEKSATSDNLMPYVIDAVEAHCTLGEIAHALREVWGEYKA